MLYNIQKCYIAPPVMPDEVSVLSLKFCLPLPLELRLEAIMILR